MTSPGKARSKKQNSRVRRKVLILGLGQLPGGSGVQSAIYFARQGADVLVTDLKTADKLHKNVETLKKFKNVRFRLGENRSSDLEWADVIVRNPDIKRILPIYKAAVKTGKPLINDVTLFLEKSPAMTVGVTGTRGKSTSTSWIHDMLKRSGKRAYLGGNITLSPLTFLDRLKKNDIAVLELSSFLLEPCGDLALSPHIAVWTNLLADHLNAYDGMADYAEAKAQVMRHQIPGDVFVPNLDDGIVASYAKDAAGEVRGFSSKKKKGSFAWVSNGWLILKRDGKEIRVMKTEKIGLRGPHNVMNALAATVGADAAGATLRGIRSSLGAFGGVPYRQQIVGHKRGITFVNDTTSTTPDAAKVALQAFCRPGRTVHWICGGADKGLDYSSLMDVAARKKLTIHLLTGTAFGKMERAFRSRGMHPQKAENLRQAFDRAVGSSKKGDIVLLSPACASFGLFRNEFDRGDQFNGLVMGLR